MSKDILKILHITPHLGGGVGRVVLNYLVKTKEKYSFNQKIICLDYANENALKVLKDNEIDYFDNGWRYSQKILSEIEKSDIVLVHWWNHPLLYDFLIRQPLPESRVILWSHISGFHPPYVFTEKILSYPDMFVFTTPVSYEVKEVQDFMKQCHCEKQSDEATQIKKLRYVWSTGGLDHVKNIKHKEHEGFNIGYIGTVDYCKMHPDFIKICSKINIPDVKFIVCGGPNQKELKSEARKMGIPDKFEFTGHVSDIAEYLSVFDIFGYPLAPYHYGTCDQVLSESMASGVVPVVLANAMEKYMVKDKITGLVAQDEEEYIKAIEYLYHNPDKRKKLSHNAKNYALEVFSLDKMIKEWENIFNELLLCPKTSKKWSLDHKKSSFTSAEVFLEALGEYGKIFSDFLNAKTEEDKNKAVEKIKVLAKNPLWQAKTRGTVHHYYEFFKEDQILQYWSNLIQYDKEL